MAFTDDKSPGQIILSQDWDDFVDFTELISGNYFGHSSNKDIHFPSSSIVDWLNGVYAQSGVTLSWSGAIEFYGFSSNIKQDILDLYSFSSASAGLYYPSSLGKSLMDFSSNTVLTKTGYAAVSDGGTIAHGLPSLPTYATVSPSGFSVNFGASCRVDVTNITVYLTAVGSRDVFWLATC